VEEEVQEAVSRLKMNPKLHWVFVDIFDFHKAFPKHRPLHLVLSIRAAVDALRMVLFLHCYQVVVVELLSMMKV